jgi:histidinol-phosphate aminotransferase
LKFINKYLRNLQPYKLASHKIWNVSKDERTKILKLDWNEATVSPSPKVKERLARLIENGDIYNLYPSTLNEELLSLLAKYVELPKENVQYFASSDALHEYIAKVYLSVGDPVLILGPSYDNFRLTCQSNGADVYYSMYTDDFKFDQDIFYDDIKNIKPAVIYICNPNNPTGNIHSVEYIKYLLNEFPDTLFILDEAYYEFSGITAKDLVIKYDNILISRTMSKAFALANFRVGYLIASSENVRLISKVRNPKNLSTFGQEAAIAVLSDIDYMNAYVSEVKRAKNYIVSVLYKYSDTLKIYNGLGNFILIKMHTLKEKETLCSFLSEHNIFVRELTQNKNLLNCFRITIGTIVQMKQVVSVIEEYFKINE